MSKNLHHKTVSTKLDLDIQKAIQEKIDEGEFSSFSEFLRKAAKSYLDDERMLDKMDALQRNLMASQLDVVAEVTGMTQEERSNAAERLNIRYQDGIFET
jgi:Arc/MetJ-type ribon-helix-helix transcriptional regulator